MFRLRNDANAASLRIPLKIRGSEGSRKKVPVRQNPMQICAQCTPRTTTIDQSAFANASVIISVAPIPPVAGFVWKAANTNLSEIKTTRC
jgi:hypothetical protein